MHEMSLAEGVVQIVEDYARRENFRRVKTVFASLAFILLAGQADERGRNVLFGTDDVLGTDVAPNEYAGVAEQHAWSSASSVRMRAEPVAGFDEGAERYEALIARMAAPLQ